jgi:hypothetical protein
VGAKELGPDFPTFESTAFGAGTVAGAGDSFAAQPVSRPIPSMEKAPAHSAIRRAVFEFSMDDGNTVYSSKDEVNYGSQG